MLAFAGHPFIMGNASEELRDRGWQLTRSNAESGVSAAVEHVLYGTEIASLDGASNDEPESVEPEGVGPPILSSL
jgi:hypothetical protein